VPERARGGGLDRTRPGSAGCASPETLCIDSATVAELSGGHVAIGLPLGGLQTSERIPSLFPDPVFAASVDVPYGAAYVTFEPGARSAWHTHPAGQRLIVTAGVGRTSVWGGPVVEIKAGDAVWCPPGVKHWHGAAPGSAMTHLALTGQKDGQNVQWLEKVSDEQYGR
jgi:quercetin dioxygenase-like cupin family protein